MLLSYSTYRKLGIEFFWGKGLAPAEILSAAGHPGYSDQFATAVLNLVENMEYSVFEAIRALEGI
jgi:hypothetical protein